MRFEFVYFASLALFGSAFAIPTDSMGAALFERQVRPLILQLLYRSMSFSESRYLKWNTVLI